jgi:cell wall-associated NlpC family hydrolase
LSCAPAYAAPFKNFTLGAPYRYGGTSPSMGFDCSGFVYYLFGAVFGQSIAREVLV